MACGSCSSGGGCAPAGCKSNGSCLTGGCQKMEVHDWLSNLDMPANFAPFPIIEVKFKGARKEFFVNTDQIYVEIGELVAVEGATGGYDIGHVSLTGELVRVQMKRRKTTLDLVTRKLYRKATEADVEKWKLAKDMEWATMHKARTLALDLNLSMKISDVDYQGDKTKATFFYTAEGRVDFRELIKKMAESFRVRIEMRQIGMRQEAGRLGGIGSCGRELCCSTWLTNFKTVSTAAARYQNLSLNTLKLAGQCGKLKCCLNYELDTYLDALKDIPDRVENLQTESGLARHQKTDIFKKLMWFSYANQEDWIPLKVDRVKEIMAMNKRGERPNNLKDEAIQLKTTEVVEVTHDYENVVGQDSLTRLDDKNRKNNNNRNRNKNKAKAKPANQAGVKAPNIQGDVTSNVKPNAPQGGKPASQGGTKPAGQPAGQQSTKPLGQQSTKPNQAKGGKPNQAKPTNLSTSDSSTSTSTPTLSQAASSQGGLNQGASSQVNSAPLAEGQEAGPKKNNNRNRFKHKNKNRNSSGDTPNGN